MKKETSIAIFLGITFGIVVALFVILRTRQAQINNSKTIAPAVSTTPATKNPSPQEETFQVSEPENGIIVSTKSVVIKGKAPKNSLIVIQSPIKNTVLKADKEEFSTSFPLALGENIILVTMYPADVQLAQREKELKVYYLDEQ